MKAPRAKEREAVLVNFKSEDAWAEYEFLFNVGTKQNKPVKFSAYLKWRSTEAPSAFAGMRGSYNSKTEASRDFEQSIGEYGGSVRVVNKQSLENLRARYGNKNT